MDFAQAILSIGVMAAAAATFTKPTVDLLVRPRLPEDRSPTLTQLSAIAVGIAWAFLLVLIVSPPWTGAVVAQTIAGGVMAGIGAIGLTESHKASRAGEPVVLSETGETDYSYTSPLPPAHQEVARAWAESGEPISGAILHEARRLRLEATTSAEPRG